jgi:hypothetical protein
MDVNNFIVSLEGYMIKDEFDIVTESLNIKDKVHKFIEMVKNFFRNVYIKIRNFIASNVFKSTMVNPEYFDDFFKSMKDDSVLYKQMVDDSITEIQKLLNKHLDGKSFKDLTDDDKIFLTSDMWKENLKHLHMSESDSYRKGLLTKSSIYYNQNDIAYNKNDNLKPVSKAKLDELMGYIRVFETEAERFGKFVSSLDIPDDDFNECFNIYSRLANAGIKYTTEYMGYLNKILIRPKEKYETKDLGGTFTVIPEM